LYDNALVKSVIGLFKTDVIYPRGPWKSIDPVEYAALEWVYWFNQRRLLGPIGHLPPAEVEQAYYDQLEASAIVMAAWLRQTGLRRTRGGSVFRLPESRAPPGGWCWLGASRDQ